MKTVASKQWCLTVDRKGSLKTTMESQFPSECRGNQRDSAYRKADWYLENNVDSDKVVDGRDGDFGAQTADMGL